MFCVNKTGNHKLKPLCVGRSQKPRCFHHVNMKAQPVVYTATKNASNWMTRTVFSDCFYNDFVPEVKKHQSQRELDDKALLLDHPAHPASENLVSHDRKKRPPLYAEEHNSVDTTTRSRDQSHV